MTPAPRPRGGRETCIAVTALAAALLWHAPARADVLWDQIGTTGADLPGTGPQGYYRYASQVFLGQPQYDVVALDDFTLSRESRITRLATVMQGYGSWSGPGAIQGFTAMVFASPQAAAGGFGNALVTLQFDALPAYNAFGTGLLCEFTTDFTLGPGSYWLGIQARLPGSSGQTGVVITNLGGTQQSFQANPGGGFGLSGNLLERPVNLAYRIEGTAVPAPGALALVAGALARTRRRHRVA